MATDNRQGAAHPQSGAFVSGAIHNPDEPRHFMRVKPIARRIRIYRDGAVLADSARALRLLEVGRDLYDPAVYIPREDVTAMLRQKEQTTHCPLKGDAVYFDLVDDNGAPILRNIAWSYATPLPHADILAGFISFYPDKVSIEESPL